MSKAEPAGGRSRRLPAGLALAALALIALGVAARVSAFDQFETAIEVPVG